MLNNEVMSIKSSVSVIIITLNEEKNIEQCLKSIHGWTDDIHIVDSKSEDRTVELARVFTPNIHIIDIRSNWAIIRQWALSNINIKYEWILFIDADEWLTERLKEEINTKIRSNPNEVSFYIYFKFVFLKKVLKHGGQYNKHMRLFRVNKVHCVPSGDTECFIPHGVVGELQNALIHQDLKSFTNWIDKHNRISTMAARRYIELKKGNVDEAVSQKTKLKSIFDTTPLVLRPFLVFFYTYFIKLGFLDGLEGLIYHLHHSFWYQLLIYTKIKEFEINEGDTRKERE